METRVTGAKAVVLISDRRPTVLVGERINLSGNRRLLEAVRRGEMGLVRELAISQVKDGADILDVNASVEGMDEAVLLPQVLKEVWSAVDVPVSIDVKDVAALKKALEICPGKPIINSVTGEEKSLDTILPLVKKSAAAVFALTIDDRGIPSNAEDRVEIAGKIIGKAESMGISRQDIIVDALALTVGAESMAGISTLEAIRKVKERLKVNQTLGVSNISYGLPERDMINQCFLALALESGVTCPILDVKKMRLAVMSIDLVVGRDQFAQHFIEYYNERRSKQ